MGHSPTRRGLGLAAELMQGNTLLELTEIRRLFEPIAIGLMRVDMTERWLRRAQREKYSYIATVAERCAESVDASGPLSYLDSDTAASASGETAGLSVTRPSAR